MKHLYTSLGSGVTSGSVTDNSITNDSVIEIYFDNTDCYIDSTSQSGHTVYFTVGGNATGTNVCVVVNNLTNFTPYDDTNIVNQVSSLENEVETLDNVVTTLETDIETLETRVDELNASNINYDEHSTLYSAMGDIDELETTSKNLVGAINEVKESGGSQEIYDSTERVIGTWFGKTLYRKVIILTTNIQFPYLAWLDIFTNDELIDITNARLINVPTTYNAERDAFFPIASYCTINKHINIMHFRSNYNITLKPNTKIMIEYTKVGE
jgi:hypothetical protein